MEITNVRIQLVEGEKPGKLCAFAAITLDGEFVVRDIRIIEGANGLFLAMPSRRLTERCGRCRAKKDALAAYYPACGAKARRDSRRISPQAPGHIDIAHPITAACRARIHNAVIATYRQTCAEQLKPSTDADLTSSADAAQAAEESPRALPDAAAPPS